MTTKPWLETWTTEGTLLRVVGSDRATFLGEVCALSHEPFDRRDRAVIRARLAAAAPALTRALLVAEWGVGDSGWQCAGCEAKAMLEPRHERGCRVDAALTAAGLPDAASRDAARKELEGR